MIDEGLWLVCYIDFRFKQNPPLELHEFAQVYEKITSAQLMKILNETLALNDDQTISITNMVRLGDVKKEA